MHLFACRYRAGVVLSVALMKEHGSLGVFAPLTAGTYPGSGRLHIIAHASTDWCDMARVASVCARRLRSKLGLRDMWASDVDLYLGKALRPSHRVGRDAGHALEGLVLTR